VVLISPGAGIQRAEDAQLAPLSGLPSGGNGGSSSPQSPSLPETLGGLKPVDVVIPRLDDSLCDPLELLTEGGEGTSGLVSAVHSNSVSVANALGSGAAEVTGFRCFLPELCEKLLGEPLLLPSPPSHWLKNEGEREKVFAQPERYCFFPFLARADTEPHKYAAMTDAGKLSLLREIQANPEAWLAEEEIVHSTVPVLKENTMDARRDYRTSLLYGYSKLVLT
jgi:uncharacterized circularly permuted ATP-grasp superfamily protein